MNLPYNLDAEKALIGSALISEEVPLLVNVQPDDFWLDAHKKVWRVILEGKRDPITIAHHVEGMEAHEVFGYINTTATSLHAGEYADIVRDYAERRRALVLAQSLAGAASNTNAPFDATSYLTELADTRRVNGHAKPIGEYLSDFESEVDRRISSPTDNYGLDVGFAGWNRATSGLQRSQLVVMAGKPGVGKTLLAMQMAEHLASGYSGVIYELEMAQGDLMARLVSAATGVPTRRMFQGYVKNEWADIQEQIARLAKLPIFLSVDPRMTTSTMRSSVAKLKAEHDIQWLIVDSLALLMDDRYDERHENIAHVSSRIRAICKEFELAGLAVHNLTKKGMDSLIPTLTGLQGSAQVPYVADNVLYLLDFLEDPEKPSGLTKAERQNMRTAMFDKMRHDSGLQRFDLVKLPNLPAFKDVVKHRDGLPVPEGEMEDRWHE